MRRLPLITPPPPTKTRERDRARKSRYAAPSDQKPEPQKPIEGRPSIRPTWARKYAADVLN